MKIKEKGKEKDERRRGSKSKKVKHRGKNKPSVRRDILSTLLEKARGDK